MSIHHLIGHSTRTYIPLLFVRKDPEVPLLYMSFCPTQAFMLLVTV